MLGVTGTGGPQFGIEYSLSLLKRLPSYASSIVHVLLTALLGCLISIGQAINPLVLVFAVTSKLFAMMFAEDRSVSKKRRIYSTIALAMPIFLLIGLSSFQVIMGVLILILYSLYPIFDGKTPLDVTHHAVRYVLIFILGYGSLTVLNEKALPALLAIVFFSVAGEILAGLRKGGVSSGSAASFLGTKISSIVVISSVFIGSIIAAFVLNSLFEFPIQVNGTFVPFYIIPALVLDLFVTKPLMRMPSKKQVDAFHLIRRKEAIVIVVMSLLILVTLQTGRTGTTVAVTSKNFSFDVHIRTIIAGRNSWDVPWVVFDYTNENNYYYVVFHKDGVLELSQKMDGQYLKYASSVKTQLTPFQWHTFHVVLNETTVTVGIDGEYQVATPRRLVADTSSVIISPTVPHPTGIWIVCMYSISINV